MGVGSNALLPRKFFGFFMVMRLPFWNGNNKTICKTFLAQCILWAMASVSDVNLPEVYFKELFSL